ncbi:hypothetical protein [Streptomyces chromofuscus]|uniref:hypothetical protein n=1 Tax=Streptomyces chromofuscus TaxID=42881 RepID=UPI001674D1E1|nr:hypothetical protein [Streptomyces chromofuscus]
MATECLRGWRIDNGDVVDEQDTAPRYLNPWEREAGWTIPPGETWTDAIVPDADRADR